MKSLRATFVRLAGLFRRSRHEAEMNEELRAHLEALVDRNLAAGMPPDEARYAAHRAFGGVEQIAERARDERRSVCLEQLWQDLRHAVRAVRKNPTFTLVAIGSVAIALGANTAIFGLIDAMWLRPLPVRNPHELILLGWERTAKGAPTKGDGGDFERSEINHANGQPITRIFSWPAFDQFRAAAAPLTDVIAMAQLWQPHLATDGHTERVEVGQVVSGNYYAALGVRAVAGRTLQPEDDRPGAAPVIVISHRYWQQRFAGNPEVVGRTVWLNRAAVTIVGVTPPGFVGTMLGGGPADVVAPLALTPLIYPEADQMPMRDPGFWWLRVMGRLAPGATSEQAQASLDGVFRALARESWNTPDALPRLIASPWANGRSEHNRRSVAEGMLPLAGMGALLLLVACANLANLLLARGGSRRREFAVRLALGAGRGRLIRQLLTESMLVALAGSVAGVLLAAWGLDLLGLVIPRVDSPDLYALQLDWRVAGFAAALAAVTAGLIGLVPALRTTRLDLTTEFQGGSRTLGGGTCSKLSRSLMIAQVALSLVLLVMAGLLARTVRNLRAVDIGFNGAQLLLFSLEGVPAGYAEGQRLAAFYHEAAERVRTIAGVRSVTFSRTPVLSRHGTYRTQWQMTNTAGAADAEVGWQQVETHFFETYEMSLKLGRGFRARDDASAPRVVVVNQALAEKYFPDENPVGRRVRIGRRTLTDVEIVGVVRDFRQQDVRRATLPTAYTPAAQNPVREAHFAVRTSGPAEMFFGLVRKAVAEVDPNVPVANLRTQAEQIEWTLADERIFARIASFFGLAALALASVGLYGLMSYGVVRRTGEIGLRVALGALPRQVLGMILRESLTLVLIGVALGLGAALAAVRLVANQLYGLSPTDIPTYAAVTLGLLAVGSLAALLPARRAAKIDPITALRAE